MRKWLAGFLCGLLMLGVFGAGAEGAPWLTYLKDTRSGEKTARFEIRLSINLDEMEREMKADLAYAYDGSELARAKNMEYLRALNAFLAETTFEFAAEKDHFLLNMTVGDYSLFEVARQDALTADGMKCILTTSDAPSFVFSKTEPFANSADETLWAIQRAIDALITCPKEDGAPDILRENIENDRQQAEYFLNGADAKTLSSDEYAALLPGAPRAAGDSAYGVVGAFAAEYIDAMDGTMDLYAATDGATYSFEKTEDGYVARMTVAEADEQGNEKIAVSTTTIKKDSVVYDDKGYANAGENMRITIDLSDPDLSRITYVSDTSNGWINFTREGSNWRASCHLQNEYMMDIKVEASVRDDGETDILLTMDDEVIVSAHSTFEPGGTLGAPDVAGKKELAVLKNGNQSAKISDEDMALVKNELYNVTRPKMIDFVLSKLPKGAEALSSVFLSAAMQIGSGYWVLPSFLN